MAAKALMVCRNFEGKNRGCNPRMQCSSDIKHPIMLSRLKNRANMYNTRKNQLNAQRLACVCIMCTMGICQVTHIEVILDHTSQYFTAESVKRAIIHRMSRTGISSLVKVNTATCCKMTYQRNLRQN